MTRTHSDTEPSTNRRLRLAFIVVHLLLFPIPAVAGCIDLVAGTSLLAPDLDRTHASTYLLDSTLRFYAGFWLGALWYLVWALRDLPGRARHVELFWGMIFVGGIGRLVGFVQLGPPPAPIIAMAVVELLGPPLFVFWLRRAWAARAGRWPHLQP